MTPVLIITGSRVMAGSYRLWRGVGACVQVHLIFISASVLISFNAMIRDSVHSLKGPKHDQVEGEFFYIKQTRMVR